MKKLSTFIHTLAWVFVATMLATSQAYGDRLFATSGASSSPSSLYELDPETGAAVLIGPIGFDAVVSIDFHPESGELYGISNRTTIEDPDTGVITIVPNELITIDTITGAGTFVATITGSMAAMSYTRSPDMGFASDGTLYTWSEIGPSNLNVIVTDEPVELDDFALGYSFEVGPNGGTNTYQVGLDVDSRDNVYLKDGFGDIYTVDRMTGAISRVVIFDGEGVDRFDNVLAFDSSDNLFTIDRISNFGVFYFSHLYSIDLATGATRFIGSTGVPDLTALAFQNTGSGPGSGFEVFTITKAEIQFDDDLAKEKFKSEGLFALDPGGEGIDPLNEVVTFGAGNVLVTIPEGSFVSGAGVYEYQGIIDGADVKVKIEQTSLIEFKFKAEAKGVDVTGTANPTEFVLTIGSKSGSALVRLGGKLKFPGKKGKKGK